MKTTIQHLILSLSVALLAGCGGADLPDLATVQGTVTMNGKPVPGVFVSSTPKEGRPSYGTVGDDGTYKLEFKKDVEGAVVGPAKISLTWPQGAAGPAIPAEFLDKDLEIKAGSNTHDIKMTSEAKEWKDFKPSAAKGPID